MPLPRRKHHKGFKPRKSRMTRGEPKRPSLSKRSAKKLREAGEKKRKAAQDVPALKASTLKRSYKKRLGTAKPKEGSRRDLERQLASLRAQEVKMRDGFRCRQCSFDGVPTQGPIDAGHVYPKGMFPGGKFLAANIVGQCRFHNTLHVSRPEFMFLWYDAENGEGSLEKLHELVLSMPRKMTLDWLREQIEVSKAAIAEMELLAVA